MFKYVEQFGSEISETPYYFCLDCEILHDDKTIACKKCKKLEYATFYELSVESQLKHMFEKRNLKQLIDDYRKEREKNGSETIRDLQDGKDYKRIKLEANGDYDITLILNLDGVQLTKVQVNHCGLFNALLLNCLHPLDLIFHSL